MMDLWAVPVWGDYRESCWEPSCTRRSRDRHPLSFLSRKHQGGESLAPWWVHDEPVRKLPSCLSKRLRHSAFPAAWTRIPVAPHPCQHLLVSAFSCWHRSRGITVDTVFWVVRFRWFYILLFCFVQFFFSFPTSRICYFYSQGPSVSYTQTFQVSPK